MSVKTLGMQVGSSLIGQAAETFDIGGKQKRRNQVEQQRKLNESARETNMKYWRDTNYVAQMDQMKEAGLNPAMLYASGGEGGTVGSASGGSASDEASLSQAGTAKRGMAIEEAMMSAQIENLKANTNKTNVEAEYTGGAKTEETESNINLQNIEAEIKKEQQYVNLRLLNTEAMKASEDLAITINNREISDETKTAQIEQYMASVENILIGIIEKEANIMLKDEQRRAIKEELIIGHINAQSGRMQAEKISVGQVLGRFISDTKVADDIVNVVDKLLPWRNDEIANKIDEVVNRGKEGIENAKNEVGKGVGKARDGVKKGKDRIKQSFEWGDKRPEYLKRK